MRTALELALERADQIEQLAVDRPAEPAIVVGPDGDEAELVAEGGRFYAKVSRHVYVRPSDGVIQVTPELIHVRERVPRHLINDENYLDQVARRLRAALDQMTERPLLPWFERGMTLRAPPDPETTARRSRVAQAKQQLKNAARRRLKKKKEG